MFPVSALVADTLCDSCWPPPMSTLSWSSFSQGFRRLGVLSTLLDPGSSTVGGISSIPGTGMFRVIRSTIAAKEVGYGGGCWSAAAAAVAGTGWEGGAGTVVGAGAGAVVSCTSGGASRMAASDGSWDEGCCCCEAER